MSYVSSIGDRRPPSYPAGTNYQQRMFNRSNIFLVTNGPLFGLARDPAVGGSEVEMDALSPSHARKRFPPPPMIERTNATTRHSQQLHPYVSTYVPFT